MSMKKHSSGYCFPLSCKKIISPLFLSVLLLLISCKSALYLPDESYVSSATSLNEMKAGRKLYVQKCAGCHTLYLPEKYTKPEWQLFLIEMQEKASVNNSEKELILKYLLKGK